MMTDEARIKKNKDETRGRHMNTDEGDYCKCMKED